MEKIDILFLALLLIGIVSMVKVEFPAITGDVVNECIDSDNGKDPFTGGNLIGYDESTKRDSCVDDNTLYEYYCADSKSNGAIEKFECFNGCVTKDGKGICLRSREEEKEDSKYGKCESGCYFRGVCLPIGTRTNDGSYCDVDEELDWQMTSGEKCLNNYECKSNICVAGQCISEEVFNKFLETIK
ncbi:MAG: hypothetical protein KKG75_03120 [Nanoarchaeota archaeon]|nr:hypothetical protein [Nanoarchaeota archaeon]